MRAHHRVSGKVRIDLPRDFETEIKVDPSRYSVVVSREAFEELAAQIREGDVEKAELRRDLSKAEQGLERTWVEMGTLREAYDAASAERDALRHLQRTEPARMVLQAEDGKPLWPWLEALTDSRATDVDELKAVIVSQAREIARLKGESE